jgi:hypothetical protein
MHRINIAITSKLSLSEWNSSPKQNSVFLYDCLSACGFNPFYLTDKLNICPINKDHKAFEFSQAHLEDFPDIDILILHGFTIKPDYFELIKKRNPNIKVCVYHHGNRIAIDQQSLISGGSFLDKLNYVDEIWVPPHHKKSSTYLKVFHGGDATVRTVPYLWSPFFIEENCKKNGEISYKKDNQKIVVLEPNHNSSKNCLIPLIISENYNNRFPDSIKSFNIFNTEVIKEHSSLYKVLSDLNISQQKKLFLNKKWKTPDVLRRIGQTVLSHQISNELNFLYLETLHLGLPLIHNSNMIKEYGYYYPDNEILTASNQLYNAYLNHEDNYKDYVSENHNLIKTFDPFYNKNIEFYSKTISQISKK